MKMLSLITVLTFSSSLLAATCFKAATELPAESKIPNIVCINSYSLDLVIPGLPKLPHYLAKVDTSLGIITENPNFHRDSNFMYGVRVSKLIVENDGGSCQASFISSIEVEFKVDAEGNKLDVGPSVSARIETNSDTCHSPPETQEIIFNRI